jgi:predicted dehydrogenase
MDTYVVVGQGSMGKRRVRCLLANGVASEQIIVCDQRDDRLAESAGKYGVRGVRSIDSPLEDPEVKAVIISVPGALHLQYILAALQTGKHWFCEVPLAVKMDRLDEVIAMTSKGLVGVSGCQLLFHPLAKALRTWSQSSTTGRILGVSYSCGMYLPEWHPYEDYRKFYASNAAMGGGNLDVIAQEVLWIRWILNSPIVAATCRMSKVGSLELAEGTPDHQEIILEAENGVMLSMHFDINDRTHERWLRLTAEYSTAKWSTLDPSVKIYDAGAAQWSEQSQPENFQYETCYHEEIAQFLRCIRTREPWPVGLSVAREIVAILQAIQVSARERRTVELQEVFKFQY